MMRLAIAVLLLLAGAKIWTQEQIYRSATEDALLQAYRATAIASCRAASQPAAARTSATNPKQIAAAFASPSRTHLEIGNRDVSVPIWEVDHAAWAMRYTYPYVILEADNPAARCSYDVKLGRASISLL
jgi:hypothetical protein